MERPGGDGQATGVPSSSTAAGTARGTVRIACDESGFVGGSLFGDARVFAHASVRIGTDEAVEVLEEVRRRTGAGPGEVKASRLRLPSARPVAEWLCGPDGRMAGRAVVHVTDTRLFGLARLTQVLGSDVPPEGWWSADQEAGAWGAALRLEALVAGLPAALERRFLLGARDLLWLRRRVRRWGPIDTWAELAGTVSRRLTDVEDQRLVSGLASRAAAERLDRYRAEPPAAPLTEPLLPALRWAVHHWSALGDPDVVHDEQSVLTPGRVAALAAGLAAAHPGRRLSGFARVDSREDPRVQVADLVVGVVRRMVEADLSSPAPAAQPMVAHLLADASPLRNPVS
jgi:hypothetical protein